MSSTIALGDWRLLFLGRDRSNKVTSEQVAAAAAHYFTRDNRTVGMFLPEDQPQRADVPAAPSVVEVLKEYKPQQAIADGEAFDPSQANIDARTQRSKVGGLKLALLPKKTRGETVSVKLDLLWGDEKSLFGKKTASELADAMLMRGSSTLTREQLADEFSKLKISGSLTQFQTTAAIFPRRCNWLPAYSSIRVSIRLNSSGCARKPWLDWKHRAMSRARWPPKPSPHISTNTRKAIGWRAEHRPADRQHQCDLAG
ncbi:hypothetical protein [Collimonas arenae]|uniref:hypothetical protein n=1 Tax=Collimonas arenae TaxID=279058 RepID=UPI002FF5CE67